MEERPKVHHRDEAVELIECYLQCHDLQPHNKLPGEREMCEMWGLNRTTLRAAIRRLTEEGKLYSLKGSGTYVAPPKLERNLQDAKSTTETVRGAGRKLRTRVLEQQIIEASPYVAEKLRISPGSQVFFLQRLRLLDGVPYMIEANYISLALCPWIADYDYGDESLYRVLAYHNLYPCQGEESVGITYATEDEARHLQMEEGDYLFFLSGVTEEQRGIPMEYFKSVARSDKVRFSSVLRKQVPDSERR